MESVILKELQELKNLTLLAAKTALTTSDATHFTGLSRSHLYKLCCYKKIPHYKSSGGKYTFFDKNELTTWMLHRRIVTDAELENVAVNYIVTGKATPVVAPVEANTRKSAYLKAQTVK